MQLTGAQVAQRPSLGTASSGAEGIGASTIIGTTSSGAVVGLGESGDFPTPKQGAKAIGDSTINRSGSEQ